MLGSELSWISLLVGRPRMPYGAGQPEAFQVGQTFRFEMGTPTEAKILTHEKDQITLPFAASIFHNGIHSSTGIRG